MLLNIILFLSTFTKFVLKLSHRIAKIWIQIIKHKFSLKHEVIFRGLILNGGNNSHTLVSVCDNVSPRALLFGSYCTTNSGKRKRVCMRLCVSECSHNSNNGSCLHFPLPLPKSNSRSSSEASLAVISRHRERELEVSQQVKCGFCCCLCGSMGEFVQVIAGWVRAWCRADLIQEIPAFFCSLGFEAFQ